MTLSAEPRGHRERSLKRVEPGGAAVIGDDAAVAVERIDRRVIARRTADAALSAMVSNTGWTSVGELEMTRRISLVAVCCSSASVSSRFRASQLREQAHVLDGDHRLVGEGLEQRDLLVGERPDLAATDEDGADGRILRGASARPARFGRRMCLERIG